MQFTANPKYEQALISTLVYIQTHLQEEISLEELAGWVGFSPFHFHRVFTEFVGESVKEYMRRLRLERSAYRLINGKEQQAELEVVAFENGSRYTVRNETQGINTVYEYKFIPEMNGTRIDLTCTVSARGLKKAMVPVVVNILKKEDGDHLQRLKSAMEGRS